GSLHFGAVIVPDGAAPGSCPVLIEAKGVSWNYMPLSLDQLTSPRILKNDASRFVVVVPGFRGEVLNFEGRSFVSEGDRSDAWDGATDDALAFLDAALSVTPEADPARIAAFGRSRGGSVALLAAARDHRIRRVIDWAGPSDWFSLMGTEGWTQRESVIEGLRIRSKAPEEGGQFIERFLARAIAHTADLQQTRHRMLASSPLWFAAALPITLAAYGVEDDMVPIRNGKELARLGYSRVKPLFLEGAGPDLDRTAFEKSRLFLLDLVH
ncbi:MAG: prolyl oligopeptidase family serine peptidase, partial [Thermoanaerobaculia bacterium]